MSKELPSPATEIAPMLRQEAELRERDRLNTKYPPPSASSVTPSREVISQIMNIALHATQGSAADDFHDIIGICQALLSSPAPVPPVPQEAIEIVSAFASTDTQAFKSERAAMMTLVDFARASTVPQPPSDQPSEVQVVIDETLQWAVERWHAEVANRPMVNVHRRTLDDTWRQVMRHLGGDPDALVGPSHDALLPTPRPPQDTKE